MSISDSLGCMSASVEANSNTNQDKALTQYRVKWEIDLDAANPVDAAKKAMHYQRPESDAHVFNVHAANGESFEVDLDEDTVTEGGKDKIVVVVKGGCVQAVHGSNRQTEVIVVDYDNCDCEGYISPSELCFSDNTSAQALIDSETSRIGF